LVAEILQGGFMPAKRGSSDDVIEDIDDIDAADAEAIDADVDTDDDDGSTLYRG
jgi:hypothetical protein